MCEEITNIHSQDVPPKGIHQENHNLSLLSIIHDKNKIIEKLQKQLHFQKLQLKYYLGKTLCNSRMIAFSKSCSAQVIEENLPVALALNRYCRQVGIKSKIISLYDRMCNIDSRISGLLQIQECFLRKMVGKICEMVKTGSDLEIQLSFRKIVSNPEYMDLFSSLLNANIGLKKNLDTFRICCDRLLIVEEERNLIVEQVYSLPIEQRTNCNYLIGIQIEKIQLQNKMKEILKDQTLLRKRVEQLNEVEERLKKIQEEYKYAFKNSTENVTDMLRKVNGEALGLIAKSNQQREKYTKEIVKLKGENLKISKLLERLKSSMDEKEICKDSLKLDAAYSAGLFCALDKEITEVIKENEMNKDCAIQKVRIECRELGRNLENVQNQNILLEKELDLVKSEYASAKRQWENELESITKERDDYKAQVEDLQAIRSAYAQLVESRADIAADAEKLRKEKTKREMDEKKVYELEQENIRLSLDISELREETNKQKSKIIRLSGIILNLNGNDQQDVGGTHRETRDAGCGDNRNEIIDLKLPETNSCTLCQKKSELEKGIIFQELERSNVSTTDLVRLVENKQLDEITSNIIQELSKSSNECRCGSLSSSFFDSSSGRTGFIETKILESPPLKSSSNIDNIRLEIPNENCATLFKVRASVNDGKTCKNENSEEKKYKNTSKIGDTSLVSVRVRSANPYVGMKPCNDVASMTKEEENEFELLRDCSLETIPHSVPPIKKVQIRTASEELSYPYRMQNSKLIKVTYRNYNDYRTTTTDSDPTTNDSQASELENSSGVNVHCIKMRLKALANVSDMKELAPVYQYPNQEKVRRNDSSH